MPGSLCGSLDFHPTLPPTPEDPDEAEAFQGSMLSSSWSDSRSQQHLRVLPVAYDEWATPLRDEHLDGCPSCLLHHQVLLGGNVAAEK